MLLPFSGAYGLAIRLRNSLYDGGSLPTVQPGVPTVCIGNLSVGGTGKTPHAEYVIDLLMKNGLNIGFISRGYGRATSGLFEITPDSTAAQVGDEPLQVFRKFRTSLKGVVSEDRVAGAEYLLKNYPDLSVLVLDDAYQHRRIARNLNILLTTYKNPFFLDWIMPSGTLREARAGARRADAVVVTKCPDTMAAGDRSRIEAGIRPYTDGPVFFSTFQNDGFRGLDNAPVQPEAPVAILTGIADGEAFADAIRAQMPVAEARHLADHHSYKKDETESLAGRLLQKARTIITTEKDAVKLAGLNLKQAARLAYVPIRVRFLFDGKEHFNQLVLNKMNANHGA